MNAGLSNKYFPVDTIIDTKETPALFLARDLMYAYAVRAARTASGWIGGGRFLFE